MMKNNNTNKWLTAFFCAWALFSFQIWIGGQASAAVAAPIIIDHNCTNLAEIPQVCIQTAKSNLHIAYGHTSHGSQLTDGMTGLVGFINGGGLGLTYPHDFFAWNNGGSGGALDLHDGAMGGDVGYYTAWVDNTHSYLGPVNAQGRGSDNPDVNVIIWSWCGQVSGLNSQQMIDRYLDPMTQLEQEYFNITFVYMTGHSDGSGLSGNLHLRNQQIRNYCIANNKVLYDFYDIECWDPDSNYYGDKRPTDGCNYDYNNDGSTSQTGDPALPTGGDRNWAMDWQASHTLGVDWYSCSSAHTQPLNANRKAYAAWWLWAMLAGWDGVSGTTTYTVSGSVTHNGSGLANVVMSGLFGTPVSSVTGYYSTAVPEGWSGTVTPTLAGYSFDPTHIEYSNVTSNQENQDYTAERQTSIEINGGGGGGGGGCFIASAAQTFNRAILALFPLLILFTLSGIYHRKTG